MAVEPLPRNPVSGGADRVREIPVDLIRPGTTQARSHFDADRLKDLADSIAESGVIQPVVLRSLLHGYELLAGERRWRAAQLAGLHQIPAIIRDDLTETEAMVLGLIENLQRESLTPIEAAAGLQELGSLYELTHEQIGERIGKSRAYVSNHLRLLKLVPQVRAWVNEGLISLGHAKVLAGLAVDEQAHWAHELISHRWSVRVLERRLAGAQAGTPVNTRSGKDSDWRAYERQVSEHLGYPVKISADASGRGEFKLSFHSLDELEGALERMGFRSN